MDEDSQKRMSLGQFLRDVRSIRRMTLREVEEASEVSNAYLSQLETGKIEKPSPHILHKLASVYKISYETLMVKAGYFTQEPENKARVKGNRKGRIPAFAPEELTQEEEEELLKYLAFLRTRERKS